MVDRKNLDGGQKSKGGSSAAAAGISGAIMGIASGALIGWSFGEGRGALIGVVVGGLYFGAVEAVTDKRRKPGELKPFWHRLIGSVVLGAALGVILGLVIDSALIIGLLMGLLVGLTGLGLRKLALGLGIGLGVGLVATAIDPQLNAAIVAGAVVLLYRLALVIFFKGSAPLALAGENIPAEEAKYVVPFDDHTGFIGAGYMESLARESDGTFKRNKPGIGIVETMAALAGPNFDPEQVDPLIREFYEHTTNFKLSIVPKWNPFMKPFFWLFKTFIAQRIGQANLPFNTEEARRGMVSYIDSIEYEGNAPSSGHINTLRGWIRAYEDSGEAIYVGIYTVVRHEDVGYVSVGFPLPEANFTATLMPYNLEGGNFILKTRDTDTSFSGHYLTYIEHENEALTILKMPTMDEEIEVYVKEGQLKTDHRFYLGGSRFLTLYYSMKRVAGDIM